MTIYPSKSSIYVKIATIGILLILATVAYSLIVYENKVGLIGGYVLTAIVCASAFYLFSKSLQKIILEDDHIILKQNIGQITILKSDIQNVQKLAFSNLTLTYGSKGFFGYIGSTMDGSQSLVKDRKSMLRITTTTTSYIVSTTDRDALVKDIQTRYHLK